MLLEDIFKEYKYHCLAKNFTEKTMINKQQEHKQLKEFLYTKRGINKLESITPHDMKAYIRSKQMAGLKATSINSMGRLHR